MIENQQKLTKARLIFAEFLSNNFTVVFGDSPFIICSQISKGGRNKCETETKKELIALDAVSPENKQIETAQTSEKENTNSQIPLANLEYIKKYIVINELLPNPVGTDTEAEWIELKNIGSEKVNLQGIMLDDQEGGSKPFLFDDTFWIQANNFLLIERSQSNLALNNSEDAVRLLDPSSNIIHQITYEETIEGMSLARNENGNFSWTNSPTPEQNNIFTNKESVKKEDLEIKEEIIFYAPINEISKLKSGDIISTAGIVTVEPGIFGAQYFYLQDNQGIQIYNYKKEFPNLHIGDYIEVLGELVTGDIENKLKTASINDIKILEFWGLPEPIFITCPEAKDDYVNMLIQVKGEITEKKASSLYLDDNQGEIEIYIKKGTSIKTSSIKIGDITTISGILIKTEDGFRLQPRNIEDIIIESENEILTQEKENTNTNNNIPEWNLNENNNQNKKTKYLIAIIVVIVCISAMLIYWFKKN